MDNTNPMNKLNPKLEELIASVRKTVLVTNMSLATALETSFMATYENDDGILVMALKPNNTAILVDTGNNSNFIIKSDVIITKDGIGERRSTIQCDTEEDADEIWHLINDKMYAWSKNEIEQVELI